MDKLNKCYKKTENLSFLFHTNNHSLNFTHLIKQFGTPNHNKLYVSNHIIGTVTDYQNGLYCFWDMRKSLFVINGRTDWVLIGDIIDYVIVIMGMNGNWEPFIFDREDLVVLEEKSYSDLKLVKYKFEECEITFDKLINKNIRCDNNRLYRLDNTIINLEFISRNSTLFNLKVLLYTYRLILKKYGMVNESDIYINIERYLESGSYIKVEIKEFIFEYVMNTIQEIYNEQNITDIIDCEYYNNLDTIRLFFGNQHTKKHIVNHQLNKYECNSMSKNDRINNLCFDIVDCNKKKQRVLYYEIMKNKLIKSKL